MMIHIEHLLLLSGLLFQWVVEKGSVAELNDITLWGIESKLLSKKIIRSEPQIHAMKN